MHTVAHHQCRQAHDMLPEVSLAFSLHIYSFLAVLKGDQKQPQLSQPCVHVESAEECGGPKPWAEQWTLPPIAVWPWLRSLLSLAAVSVQQ